MSRTLNVRFKERGTRFLVYPQSKHLRGFGRPEIVYVDAPPGSIKAGPADQSIYVVDFVDKIAYKEFPPTKPPYRGSPNPPAKPDRHGHFNRIKPTDRAFYSAMVFATVRCVRQIWEDYFGHELRWHATADGRRLEVVPLVRSDNAWAGDGFLEFGFANNAPSRPFCENFDSVAHEVSHEIGWAVIGKPRRRSMDYRANDEACADLMAIVASLHFASVVSRLLAQTRGNLFSLNLASRIGERGERGQIRKAFNAARMTTVTKPPRSEDPRGDKYKFNLARPFTGGAFDVFGGIYERGLVQRRAIPESLCRRIAGPRRDPGAVQREFAACFRRRPAAFRAALFDARDYFGRLLARALEKTPRKERSHKVVALNMLAADAELNGGRYASLIRESFEWRQILPGPWGTAAP